MKKILSALLVSAMILTSFAGCSTKTDSSSSSTTTAATTTTAETTTAAETTTTAATTTVAGATTTTKAGTTKTATVTTTVKKGNSYTAPANLTGTVTFSGSTSVYPVAAALTEAFRKKNPNVVTRIDNVTGSGAGLTDAINKKVSFGMRSSAWDNSNAKIKPFQIALDGVAIVANTGNAATNVTFANIKSIYSTGLAGFSNPIIREAGSGTRTCFEDVMKANGGAPTYPGSIQTEASTDAVISAVKGNVNSVGYASLGAAENASGIKILQVEGVTASTANVLNGSYKFQRPFLLLHNTDMPLTNAEKEFLKFALSDEGQKIIASLNYISLSSSQLSTELGKVQ